MIRAAAKGQTESGLSCISEGFVLQRREKTFHYAARAVSLRILYSVGTCKPPCEKDTDKAEFAEARGRKFSF